MRVTIKDVPFEFLDEVVRVLRVLAEDECVRADVVMRDGAPYVSGVRPSRLEYVTIEASFTGDRTHDSDG